MSIDKINHSGMSWLQSLYRAEILIEHFIKQYWFKCLDENNDVRANHPREELFYYIKDGMDPSQPGYEYSIYYLANSFSIRTV